MKTATENLEKAAVAQQCRVLRFRPSPTSALRWLKWP